MTEPAFVLDAARTPFGRNRGGLAHVRTDDLAAAHMAEPVGWHGDTDLVA